MCLAEVESGLYSMKSVQCGYIEHKECLTFSCSSDAFVKALFGWSSIFAIADNFLSRSVVGERE